MKSEWINLQAKVQSKLQPILIQEGYSLQKSGATEDDDDIAIWYEKDSTHRILIDALKRIMFEAGIRRDFNWLRVDIAGKYLKEFLGAPPDANVYLQQGWTWVTDEELDQCIEEIVKGLNTYFEAHPE